MATRLHMGSRFQLARLLRQDGLPPFSSLSDWVFVLQSLWESEATGTPLLRIARRIGIEPATTYRRYTRTLGVPWSTARSQGFAWALTRFLHTCRRPPQARHSARGAVIFGGVPESSRRDPPLRRTGSPADRSPARNIERETTRIMLGQAPTDVAIVAPGTAYVTRAYAGVVDRIDLAARRSVAAIPVGVNPTRIALEPGGKRVCVSNQLSGSVSVIDTATDRVVDEIPVAGDPTSVVVATNRQILYLTTNLDRVYAIDVRAKRVIAEAELPAASHHLAIHPDRKRLFVATRSAGIVLELDANTLERLRSIRVDGYAQGLALAEGDELYVANESGWVDVLNLESGDIVASLRLDAGAYGLDLSHDHRWLFITLPAVGRVAVISRATLRHVQTIQTGGSPRHTAFTPDGRKAVIVNEGGWLDVLTLDYP